MVNSNWGKFRLLMWKNWLLHWRHKFQIVVEILTPITFCALLILVRTQVETHMFESNTIFNPLHIDTLNPLRNQMPPIQVDWTLAYSPQNPQIDNLMDKVREILNLDSVIGVVNDEALASIMVQRPTLLAGIVFHTNNTITQLPKNLDYTIRFPSELRSRTNGTTTHNWQTGLMFPIFSSGGPRRPGRDDGGLPPGYHPEGFIAIQWAIVNAYVQMEGKVLPTILLQRFPFPPYTTDGLMEQLESFGSLMIMLSFLYPAINIVKFIAVEKEKQLKEAMKIMGLPNWLHWTGWFVKSMASLIISLSIIVLILKVEWVPGASIFTLSDWTTLWVYLFVYSISTICFCFMVSVFFNKANTAAALAALFWVLIYVPYSVIDNTDGILTLGQKMALSLFSNTAMAFGFEMIFRLEGLGTGLQWSNMWVPVSIDNQYSVGLTIVMLLITSLIYLLVTLYVEQVFPGQYGIPKKWNYPFQKSYWSPRVNQEYENQKEKPYDHMSEEENKNFESDPKKNEAGIKIHNLRKVYANGKVAVQGLTINMFDNQITVLLGHNGAGKTTTMSMLTGMVPPTTGTATLNGRDLVQDIEGVRNSLGICPQHNILFDELTVREHLKFYGFLKGLSVREINSEIVRYVRLIDLEPKIDAQSRTLSGGMKRKLSVCVALCGGSKVILLDEPTSGMDPAARRALWDLIQTEKKGRTILLSTHFMDEADVLGDRIAIMADGALKCYGSSFFLKKRFGVGYHLTCVKNSDCISDKVTDMLRDFVPNIQIENDIGTELSYQLPDSLSSEFNRMFTKLEELQTDLGLDSFGVSLTTLEEVFMKVGKDDPHHPPSELDVEVHDNGNFHQINLNNAIEGSQSTLQTLDTVPLLKGVNLSGNQWLAMVEKKFYYTLRNWIILVLKILIPVVFVIISIFAARIGSTQSNLPPLPISFSTYRDTVTVLEPPTSSDGQEIADQYRQVIAESTPYTSLEDITTNETFSDFILRLSLLFLPRISSHYLVGATITSANSVTAWFNNQAFHTAPLSLNVLLNAIVRSLLGDDRSITLVNYPNPYTAKSQWDMLSRPVGLGFQLASNLGLAISFSIALFILFYIKERESRSKLLQFVSGVNVFTFWMVAFLLDYLMYIFVVIGVIVTLAIFQEQNFSTVDELGRLMLLLLLLGLALVPIKFIASKFFSTPAHAFTVMSMIHIFTGMSLFTLVMVMGVPSLELEDIVDVLNSVFMIFPLFSFCHATNNLNIATQMDRTCNQQCALIPGCTKEFMCMAIPICCNIDYWSWEEPGIGRNIFFLILFGLVTFAVLFLVEYRVFERILYCGRKINSKDKQQMLGKEIIDSDVLAEKERIAKMSMPEITSNNLVLRNMTKFYKNFLAVNQLSVAVGPSECFGLLGINGAGKTSTFKMLTGDERISSGEAWINGISLKSNMNRVYQRIGYCPQFDALLEDLTGRETLRIYCLLRGVPNKQIREVSNQLAMELNFYQHIDKKVMEYSGGNKRKLSTAIALIGNPSVIYLDEPTTGMDPGAKRQFWNVICKVRNSNRTIILTSHSMEECEALCTRLTIMVNGEFKCLGSTQHLKSKFSKGFLLTIKIQKDGLGSNTNSTLDYNRTSTTLENGLPNYSRSTLESVDPDKILSVKRFVSDNFPKATLTEEYLSLLTYYIADSSLKWSHTFGLLEDAKSTLSIEDYTLSQTSLEQVFLSFTKYQKEDERT